MSAIAAGATRNGVRGEMREYVRALSHAWPITDEVRRDVVQKAIDVLNGCPDKRTTIMAMKVLLLADQINVRREHNDNADRHADNRESIDRLRAMLQTPEGRALALEQAKRLGEPPAPVVKSDSPVEGPPPARAGEEGEGGG